MFKSSRYGDRYIDISFLVISVLGIIMIGSASVDSSGAWHSAIINIIKQIVFVGSGFVLMTFLRNKFNPKKLNMNLQ